MIIEIELLGEKCERRKNTDLQMLLKGQARRDYQSYVKPISFVAILHQAERESRPNIAYTIRFLYDSYS
jgi:hypothetical protein